MSKSNLSDQKKYPLVSIVTPAYNAMPFLAETIESVRMQKYPSVEHIIIDGGSTDGTQELLKQQPGLVWISEPDHGQSEALNKGFRRAQGEIIGWLNADDTYTEDAIFSAVNFLSGNSEIDIVHSDVKIIDQDSHLVGVSRSRSIDFQGLLFDNPIKQPTVFMRRRVIDRLGGVNENLKYVMDREFWLRAILEFRFGHLPGKFLANFRLCPGTKSFSGSHRFRAEWLNVLESAQQVPEFQNTPPKIWESAIRENRSGYFFALMINSINQKKRIEMFRYFCAAFSQDWKITLNRGTWLFLGYGLLGCPMNMYRRFRKE